MLEFEPGIIVSRNPETSEPDTKGKAKEKWNLSVHPKLLEELRKKKWSDKDKDEQTRWYVARYDRTSSGGYQLRETGTSGDPPEAAKGSQVVAVGPGIKVMTDPERQDESSGKWEIYLTEELVPLLQPAGGSEEERKTRWMDEQDTGWKVRGYFRRIDRTKYQAAAADVKCH